MLWVMCSGNKGAVGFFAVPLQFCSAKSARVLCHMGYVLWVMCSGNKGAVGFCAVPRCKFALQKVQGYSATWVMCYGLCKVAIREP